MERESWLFILNIFLVSFDSKRSGALRRGAVGCVTVVFPGYSLLLFHMMN